MLKQQKTENPTVESYKKALRVSFDGRLKLEFHGSKVTSDAGLLAYHELDGASASCNMSEKPALRDIMVLQRHYMEAKSQKTTPTRHEHEPKWEIPV